MEASKLRAEYEKKDARYEGYIERLERKAGHDFRPGEDGMFFLNKKKPFTPDADMKTRLCTRHHRFALRHTRIPRLGREDYRRDQHRRSRLAGAPYPQAERSCA